MKLILAIGTGSFIGGIFRYLISQFFQTRYLTTFPFGTLVVNILGCFLIGIVFSLSVKGNISQDWRIFLATGVLGGFTTFSAFSNETIGLLRYGHLSQAIAYVLSSVLLGLLATFIAIKLF